MGKFSRTFSTGSRVSADALNAVAEVQSDKRLAAAAARLTDRGGREVKPLQGKGGSSWRYRQSN